MMVCSKVVGVLIAAVSCALGLQMEAVKPPSAPSKGGQGGVLAAVAAAKEDEGEKPFIVDLVEGGSMSLLDINGLQNSSGLASLITNFVKVACSVVDDMPLPLEYPLDAVEEKFGEQNFWVCSEMRGS